MLKLSANIVIFSNKTWKFSTVSSVEIERDIEKITTTCKIVLPKKIKWHKETSIPVKIGDKVEVSLGYDNKLEGVFVGYIKKVSVRTPVTIECDDSMYLLKKANTKKKSYPNATLKQILTEQIPSGIEFETYSTQSIGNYVVDCDTVAQLLGELSEAGISSFFYGYTLKVGMIHDHTATIGQKKQVLADNINIIDDLDLKWIDADEITLKIKASGTDKAGKKISVEVGDDDGEVRSFFKYNTTEAQLKAEATKKLKDWKISGLSGSLTTFGQKYIWPLDVVKIKQEGIDRGTYKVLKNTTTFSTEGYRQQITIGGQNE